MTGRHLGAPHDTIYCRSGGTYPTAEVLGRGALLPGAEGQAADLSWVLLRIPNLEVRAALGPVASLHPPPAPALPPRVPWPLAGLSACRPPPQEGCHRVEAQRGVFVSPPHSLLVLRDAAAAAELLQLEWADSCVGDAPELLHRLGAVLGFARRGAWRADAALQRRVASAAQELAATCIVQRWPAVLRLVLPLTSCGCSVAAAVEGVERHLGGIPVLHAAGAPPHVPPSSFPPAVAAPGFRRNRPALAVLLRVQRCWVGRTSCALWGSGLMACACRCRWTSVGAAA